MTSPAALLLPPCCTSASLPSPALLPSTLHLAATENEYQKDAKKCVEMDTVVRGGRFFYAAVYYRIDGTALWYTPLDNVPVVTASGR